MYKTRMIIELLGAPQDYLVMMLHKIIDEVRKRGKVTKDVYAKPKKAGDVYYSTFVEFECELDSLEKLFGIAVDLGPSVIEVLEPKEIRINSGEFQLVLNDLVAKIHEMDKTIKILKAQNMEFQKKVLQQKGTEIPKKARKR